MFAVGGCGAFQPAARAPHEVLVLGLVFEMFNDGVSDLEAVGVGDWVGWLCFGVDGETVCAEPGRYEAVGLVAESEGEEGDRSSYRADGVDRLWRVDAELVIGIDIEVEDRGDGGALVEREEQLGDG